MSGFPMRRSRRLSFSSYPSIVEVFPELRATKSSIVNFLPFPPCGSGATQPVNGARVSMPPSGGVF